MLFYIQQLKDWQALAGSMIALTAALITVVVMWTNTSRQLTAQKKQSQDQRSRRLLACRAALPADLSTITQYAMRCAELSATMYKIVSDEAKRGQLVCPTLPERVIANLQLLIEHLDDANAHAVAEMLSCYQVRRARLSSLIDTYNHPGRFGRHNILTENNVEMTFEQTVHLHLLVGGAFKFARRQADDIAVEPFEEDVIANSLANLELTDVLSPEYREFLLRAFSAQPDQND